MAGGAVSEGGAAGSPLHHSQTHSSENKQNPKLHQREGSRGSFPPGTPRRGEGQNKRWGWWTTEWSKNCTWVQGQKMQLSVKKLQRLNRWVSWQLLRPWLSASTNRLQLQVRERCYGSQLADLYVVTAKFYHGLYKWLNANRQTCLSDVLLLLFTQSQLDEELLQFLVAVVDDELLKAVVLSKE